MRGEASGVDEAAGSSHQQVAQTPDVLPACDDETVLGDETVAMAITRAEGGLEQRLHLLRQRGDADGPASSCGTDGADARHRSDGRAWTKWRYGAQPSRFIPPG